MTSPVRRSSRATLPPTKAAPLPSPAVIPIPASRLDRSARFNNGNNKSTTPHSFSSEDMSEPPRRSRRSHLTTESDIKDTQEPDEEGAEDEEEITRCICGQQEYPGHPLSEVFSNVDVHTEDAGGLFIQCDGCSVWQHGGCVGIVEESQSPDKYYCEECRPKQHEVHTDPRGQSYSLYLPVTAKLNNRKSSISKSSSDDKVKKERVDASRASADPISGKRRATMRSRELDEEAEQIQRAIEESQRDSGTGRRNGKRTRDESNEDAKQEAKRLRRASESIPMVARTASLQEESDDDQEGNPLGRTKKARAEAVQSARQIELREKEKERERARAEAAGRRQERAGRRRVDDPDPSDETPRPNNSAKTSPPASSLPPSPPGLAAADKTSHKKGAGKKVKKLGNNQYTKNRGEPIAASPHGRKRHLQNTGISSGDEQTPNGDALVANSTPSAPEVVGVGPGKGRWGKGKKALNGIGKAPTSEPVERTIPNMARNLDGMMAFIQRAQLEVANDRARLTGTPGDSPAGMMEGGAVRSPDTGLADGASAMELADQLTRGIREWQEKYGSVT